LFSFPKSATALRSVSNPIFTFSAIRIIPGLRFRIKQNIFAPERWRASAIACSLPPPPITNAFAFMIAPKGYVYFKLTQFFNVCSITQRLWHCLPLPLPSISTSWPRKVLLRLKARRKLFTLWQIGKGQPMPSFAIARVFLTNLWTDSLKSGLKQGLEKKYEKIFFSPARIFNTSQGLLFLGKHNTTQALYRRR